MNNKTINTLPDHTSLGGVRFKHPATGEVCIYVSQWQKGVWYRKQPNETRIYPLFVNDLKEVLDYELVEA